jgi:hypothetical protein
VKVHVHVDGSAARSLRRQMDVANLLPLVKEVIAVGVEKRVERDIELLARQDRRYRDAVLAVDLDLDAVPRIGGAVVDGETAAVKQKGFDVRWFRAREAQAQARNCGGQRERCVRDRALRSTAKGHGL